jgi:hypothetical protein
VGEKLGLSWALAAPSFSSLHLECRLMLASRMGVWREPGGDATAGDRFSIWSQKPLLRGDAVLLGCGLVHSVSWALLLFISL